MLGPPTPPRNRKLLFIQQQGQYTRKSTARKSDEEGGDWLERLYACKYLTSQTKEKFADTHLLTSCELAVADFLTHVYVPDMTKFKVYFEGTVCW